MGVTGAGKSTFISLLSEESIEIGQGLDSRPSPISNLRDVFLADLQLRHY
jgi:type IV secretory pathway VirB4 component